MGSTFKAEKSVVDMMKRIINDRLPHLSLIQDEIVVMFDEKTRKTHEGREIQGKTQKVTPELSVLTDKKFTYRFKVVLPMELWNQWTDEERESVLHHRLCMCGVEEDEETGELKTYLRVPDIVYFAEELDHKGDFRPVDDETWLAFERMCQKLVDARQGGAPKIRKVEEPALPPKKKRAPPKPNVKVVG